jgi:N-acetylmuramoyl-L-alanine amidase
MNPRGIVFHLTASTFGDAAEIDKWHKQNGWSGIGYHRVILNGVRRAGGAYAAAVDGIIENGRADHVPGAHCKAAGMNQCTLGIASIGTPGRVPAGAERAPAEVTASPYLTRRQFDTLVRLAARLCLRHGMDPTGTFRHPTTGRTHPVITQHADHEAAKPTCASLHLATVRAAVARELARLRVEPAPADATRTRGTRRTRPVAAVEEESFLLVEASAADGAPDAPDEPERDVPEPDVPDAPEAIELAPPVSIPPGAEPDVGQARRAPRPRATLRAPRPRRDDETP